MRWFTAAAAGSLYYAYIDASEQNGRGTSFTQLSINVTALDVDDDGRDDNDCLCLRFYYHMYGVGIGDLLVAWSDTSESIIGQTVISGGAYK